MFRVVLCSFAIFIEEVIPFLGSQWMLLDFNLQTPYDRGVSTVSCFKSSVQTTGIREEIDLYGSLLEFG
jgi:hypothetical protein